MRSTAGSRFLILGLAAGGLLASCIDGGSTAGDTGLAIEVAPLSLDGVSDASYTIRVTNAADGAGQVVWERTALTSSQYGDGAGSLSFVGTCDASTATNSVTLTLDALYGDGGAPIAAGSYRNPGALTRNVVCVDNTDVSVAFDITIVREAQQGFFDVAVSFNDVFCSAKLDCVDQDTGGDLELLHNGGARDLTAVLGFACTAQAADGATTYLYVDDPVITCDGTAFDGQSVTFDVGGVGNVDLGSASNPHDYLFAAAVFRGDEALLSKAYWNISFGLNDQTFGLATTGACTLTARATASATALAQSDAGFALPEGSVYPVIDWSVPLTSDTLGRVCTTHQVNGDDGVATNYLGYISAPNQFTWASDPITLLHEYSTATGEVISGNGALCDADAGCTSGFCDAGVCATAPSGGQQVLSYTGGDQQFIVPAGVTALTVQAWGAGGGGGDSLPGAAGGYAEATIPVTPGSTLTIVVGGRGIPLPPSSSPVAGGYGGGGDSGTLYGRELGGSGGGLSGVFSGGATMTFDATGQSRALVIAGGGAGGSARWDHSSGQFGGNTGAGGGTEGLYGSTTDADTGYVLITARRGAPGTQSYYANGCTSYCDASAHGTALRGGTGGGYGGSGGGGGYFGGGGGSAYVNGAGGSGYVTAAATASLLLAGDRQAPPYTTDAAYVAGVGIGGARGNGSGDAGEPGGHGLVVLTWDGGGGGAPTTCPTTPVEVTTPGASTYDVPSGCTTVRVDVVGGGGGGGPYKAYYARSGGGGGAGGHVTWTVSPGATLSLTVGAGGGAGVAGGDTVVSGPAGTITAGGGGGGEWANPASGGAGGVMSGAYDAGSAGGAGAGCSYADAGPNCVPGYAGGAYAAGGGACSLGQNGEVDAAGGAGGSPGYGGAGGATGSGGAGPTAGSDFGGGGGGWDGTGADGYIRLTFGS